jgi:tRNA-dihydrouridine synthase 3
MEAEPAKIDAVPEVEAQKRDASDNAAAVEEPPAKKARIEENPNADKQDMRDRGVAPIKAEYGFA